MKGLKLKKLIAVAMTLVTVSAVSPVSASAAWKQDSYGWWNTEGNSYSTGWRSIDGAWYYFGSDGYMKTGWVKDGANWYYMTESGAMKTGWVISYGAGYGQWYYMGADGAMKTGWINDGGTWYFLKDSGAMATGWVLDNGTWYFTSVSGAMQTGVIEIDGKVYYLQPSGAMATGKVTINGVEYTFAASGEAIGDKIPKAEKYFSANGTALTKSQLSTKNSSEKEDKVTEGEKEEEKKTSGGGGGGSHSSRNKIPAGVEVGDPSDPVTIKLAKQYKDDLSATVQELEGKKVIIFNPDEVKGNTEESKNEVIEKDLYITNGTLTPVPNDEGKIVGYEVTDVPEGQKADVRTVVRVVKDGKVYYMSKAVNL